MRLNKIIRNHLITHAHTLIANEKGELLLDKKLATDKENLRTAAIRIIRTKCPPEHVKILKKYNYITTYKAESGRLPWLYLNAIQEWGQTNYQCRYAFQIQEGEQISLPNHNVPLRPDHPFWKDKQSVEQQKHERDMHLSKRLRPYTNLIHSSTTMKQVLATWPEAAEANCGGHKQLPARLSDSDTKAIEHDAITRMLLKKTDA